jgi:hypothetical protein
MLWDKRVICGPTMTATLVAIYKLLEAFFIHHLPKGHVSLLASHLVGIPLQAVYLLNRW